MSKKKSSKQEDFTCRIKKSEKRKEKGNHRVFFTIGKVY